MSNPQFDAKEHGIPDALYQLYYEGRSDGAWSAGRTAYRELVLARRPTGEPLVTPRSYRDQTLMGMKIVVDSTLPDDTIELRDVNNRIVGKIYNIG
jgi:hypothetical protein